MKKNLFYHPLVKGLCLILCFLSILAFAFCGMRSLYLESFGMMRENAEFDIPNQHHLRWNSSIKLWWPSEWQWNSLLDFREWNDYWLGEDALADAIREQLQSPAFFAYLYDGRVLEENVDEVTYTYHLPDGTTEEESGGGVAYTNTDSVEFPEIVTESNMSYPKDEYAGLKSFLDKYPGSGSNLRFRVLLDDRVILTNDAAWDETLIYDGRYSTPSNGSNTVPGHTVTLEYGILQKRTLSDDYRTYVHAWQMDAMQWEGWLLATGIAAFASLICLLCVLVQAGMRYSAPGVKLNVIDRLPYEITLFVKGGLAVICMALIFALEWYHIQMVFLLFGYIEGNLYEWLVPLGIIALFAAFVIFILSILREGARRLRGGKWWRNTLVYRILRLLVRGVRFIWDKLRLLSDNLPLVGKWLAGCALFGLWTLIVMLSHGLEVLWFITALAAGVFLCFYMFEFDIVRRGAKKIASGEINHYTDTARLHGAPKQIGDSLNHIGDAISVAVEDRMKSERFRTQLITNVSHDLKTPLTSIINYTDLLAKEPCENETMREYIDVLSRQAVRLKKLTEDLLEASKASTGTLAVSLTPTDAAELLTQAVGEYEERFSARELHAVLDIRQNPLWIRADGKHLWRVFDNLLGNICKYSMPGTRVYLTAEQSGDAVVMTFRNISENPISVSAGELTERFVRGDASRHTEGSGLGLAIADSLCKLQGGTLSLTVDGDLFKAVVSFDVMQVPAEIVGEIRQ